MESWHQFDCKPRIVKEFIVMFNLLTIVSKRKKMEKKSEKVRKFCKNIQKKLIFIFQNFQYLKIQKFSDESPFLRLASRRFNRIFVDFHNFRDSLHFRGFLLQEN